MKAFPRCRSSSARRPAGRQRYSEAHSHHRRSRRYIILMTNGHIYDFVMKDIDGDDVPLRNFRGKVLLVVNVASKCGFTPQYRRPPEPLRALQGKGGSRSSASPANDFLWQEPGSDQEIKQFCSMTYNVSFPLFSKIPSREGTFIRCTASSRTRRPTRASAERSRGTSTSSSWTGMAGS